MMLLLLFTETFPEFEGLLVLGFVIGRHGGLSRSPGRRSASPTK